MCLPHTPIVDLANIGGRDQVAKNCDNACDTVDIDHSSESALGTGKPVSRTLHVYWKLEGRSHVNVDM